MTKRRRAPGKKRDSELVARKSLEWHGRRFKAKDGRIIAIESGGFRQFEGKTERVGRVDIALVEQLWMES